MNPKVLFVAGAVVVGAGAGAFAWKKLLAVRETRRAIAAVLQTQGEQLEKIRTSDAQLARAEAERGEWQALLASIRKTRQAGLDQRVASKPAARVQHPLERLEKDPAMQVLQQASQRALLGTRYGALFRALNLSADQIAKFDELVSRHEEEQRDLGSALRAQNISMSDPTAAKVFRQENSAYDAAQTDLLGADGFRQLVDYDRTSWARELVSGMAGAATLAGDPFTREQAEQLIGVIAAASSSYAKGSRVTAAGLDWKIVDDQARGLFSERQAELIKNVEASGPRGSGWRYLSELNRVIGEARKADAAGTVSQPKSFP